ncbi:MAG TPA: hypothetical protein VFP25_01440 [Nitrososphaeraceae archaeon]|nr:hypothetical protein [Nitrososphaeraceae archaeon]
MNEMSSINDIYPKLCGYGCNTQIYWNTSVNEYLEALTQKKYICPNRPVTTSPRQPATSMTTTNTSTFYNKKLSIKPKMSNSFELLHCPINEVRRLYEVLSDIVINTGGKGTRLTEG